MTPEELRAHHIQYLQSAYGKATALSMESIFSLLDALRNTGQTEVFLLLEKIQQVSKLNYFQAIEILSYWLETTREDQIKKGRKKIRK